MPAPAPLTPDERARIIELRAQHHSIRAIAADVGRGTGTVSRVLRQAGITSDTTQTANATTTRHRRALNARLDLIEDLDDQIRELRDGMWDDVVESHNTTDGVRLIRRPPSVQELRNSVQAITALIDRRERILATVDDGTATHQRSVLDGIRDGLASMVDRDKAANNPE